MNTFRPAAMLFLMLSVICGLLYPIAMTGLGQGLFSAAVNGSLINVHGKTMGSALIGQTFTSPRYFWSRPSATSPQPYNGIASGGSNLGPSNPALIGSIKDRIAALQTADPANRASIPIDLVTASGSGLDPDISLAAALYQAPRVARERRLSLSAVENMIHQQASMPFAGLFGEARVNVLRLNLVLDERA